MVYCDALIFVLGDVLLMRDHVITYALRQVKPHEARRTIGRHILRHVLMGYLFPQQENNHERIDGQYIKMEEKLEKWRV